MKKLLEISKKKITKIAIKSVEESISLNNFPIGEIIKSTGKAENLIKLILFSEIEKKINCNKNNKNLNRMINSKIQEYESKVKVYIKFGEIHILDEIYHSTNIIEKI